MIYARAHSTISRRDRSRNWLDWPEAGDGLRCHENLKPKPGGCFCEKLVDGGSVPHGREILAQAGKILRLESALGPFQAMAVTGERSFALAPNGTGHRVTMLSRLQDFASGGPVGP